MGKTSTQLNNVVSFGVHKASLLLGVLDPSHQTHATMWLSLIHEECVHHGECVHHEECVSRLLHTQSLDDSFLDTKTLGYVGKCLRNFLKFSSQFALHNNLECTMKIERKTHEVPPALPACSTTIMLMAIFQDCKTLAFCFQCTPGVHLT